ncbi:MAG: FMN-binding protein [Treponema sp.]|nr:FMN-binding protein [Treponema sp.]
MKIPIDVFKSIFILSFICLFMAGALAVVNHFTYPKIESDAAERAYVARSKIIPEADGFVLMDIDKMRVSGMPESIIEVYKTTNETGYIFTISVNGFGRENMRLLCGVNMDGRIIESNKDDLVLSHTETPSYFNKVFTVPHLSRFWNSDKTDIEKIDAVSGATVSSNALQRAFVYALSAFEIIRENQYE